MHASPLRLITLIASALISFPSLVNSQPVERVTTMTPYPRGLAMQDGELIVLSRGRVRGAGGVTAAIDDRAGTLFRVDPAIGQSTEEPEPSEAIQQNGEVLALPTDGPFYLWDRNSVPPESDHETDRPYCTLRWHEASKSYYICAFSGVDKPRNGPGRSFSKNLMDGILRYDTRTNKWSEVERHDIEAGGLYPHHDPANQQPPHGWLNGPDNILPVGNWLYGVGKDNSLLVRYDLHPYINSSESGAADSEWFLGESVRTTNAGHLKVQGHSALAWDQGYLYLASRTSSHLIRMKMDAEGTPAEPRQIELIALFDPWTPDGGQSADITDIAFDDQGRLYVINAKPSRVHRFTPNPDEIYDARDGKKKPWKNFSELTNNPQMKSENILFHDGLLYITSGDGYGYQAGAEGTVYKIRVVD